jgi:hypothetical protein
MKVYCKDCEYLKFNNFGFICQHEENFIIEFEDTFYTRRNISYHKLCKNVNYDNNCKLFKTKS